MKKLFFFIIPVLLFSSCAAVYVANSVNTPLHTGKGEMDINFNGGTSGFDPQVSYALTDHIGLMLNGSFISRDVDTTENYHEHYMADLGVGYYTNFGNHFVFETYGGYSLGEMGGPFGFSLPSDAKEFSRAAFNRVFFQPAIGFTSQVADLAFTPRMSLVNLRVKEGEYANNSYSNLYFEPVVTAGLGYQYVKFTTQLGISAPLTSTEDYTWRWIIFNIGLKVQLGQSFD